jgi:dephospho-CoA kinase
MGGWPGKYVIGLTGNIATGKSVVRKMLEHLGAYGIDADALAHRVITLGAPGYQPVVDLFGKWILTKDGQIDRTRLGRVVFADADALAKLEAIVHPYVRQAVDILARRSQQPVLVIEAIKLIESSLRERCNSLWVTYTPREMQMIRLMQKRGMSELVARQRINAQSPQQLKIAVADVVISNDGSYDASWRQVTAAWQKVVPPEYQQPKAAFDYVSPPQPDRLLVERARPRQAAEIAVTIQRLSPDHRQLNAEDIMAAFGEKAFLLLKQADRIVGIAGWRVENLVARADDIYLEPGLVFSDAISVLLAEVEHASSELLCEVLLLFLPNPGDPDAARAQEIALQQLDYRPRRAEALEVRAWQDAAAEILSLAESLPAAGSGPGSIIMFFKQLRQERVLRPV